MTQILIKLFRFVWILFLITWIFFGFGFWYVYISDVSYWWAIVVSALAVLTIGVEFRRGKTKNK